MNQQHRFLLTWCVLGLSLCFSMKSLPDSQVNILHDLFDATNGQWWDWKPTVLGLIWNFDSPNPAPCGEFPWQGLNCSSSCSEITSTSTKCFIESLSLVRYNLTGYLPDSIGNFSKIKVLDLSRNHIGGTIPSSIGKLSSLEYLHLGSFYDEAVASEIQKISFDDIIAYYHNYTQFSEETAIDLIENGISENARFKLRGRIPSEIGGLYNLKYLNLNNNLLSQELPSQLFSLSQLTDLRLVANRFNGSLSENFGEISHCKYLDLSLNRISGSIPTSIKSLSSMEFVYLVFNKLGGAIPSEIGHMTKLRSFVLSFNRLTGSIPTEIGLLTDLRQFVMTNNKLVNIIPTEIGNLRQLKELGLQDNSLTGTIPTEIGHLSNIREIVLGNNSFVGPIPSEIGKLKSLSQLQMVSNYLTGTLPPALFDCQNLFILDLTDNFLNGSIPDNMKSLKALSNCSDAYVIDCANHQYLHILCNVTQKEVIAPLSFISFAANHLTGQVPKSITSLSCLGYIDLSDNSLTGPIPEDIDKMEVLSNLIFGLNSLSGSIPSSITHLAKLGELELSNNRFRGVLPSNWDQHAYLKVLSVAGNHLTGSIPSEISNLQRLQVLSLNSNSLTGTIPSTIRHLGDLRTLLLSNNQFRGPLTWISPQLRHLESIDISSNIFSGQLSDSLFNLSSIQTISLTKNCFHGTIPDSVCVLSPNLTSLALNGLSAGDSCKIPILPILHTYTAKFMHGTIPTCLFSMSKMRTLQLTGNGLYGTLPDLASLPMHLNGIYVAFNRLSGTIPTCFSQPSLEVFDVSSNQLTGTADSLSAFFNSSKFGNGSLTLKQNRLSGNIPVGFQKAPNIDILRGNLFGCKSKSELPVNDPAYTTTGCGTNFITLIMIVALGLVTVASLLVYFAWNFDTFGVVILRLFRHCSRSTSVRTRNGDAVLEVPRNQTDVEVANQTASQTLHNVETLYLFEMFPEVRVIVKQLVLVMLLLFLPLCLALKQSTQNYTTYTHQYSLTPSITYLTGNGPAIGIFVLVAIIALLMESRISRLSRKTFRQLKCRDSVNKSVDDLAAFVERAYSQVSVSKTQTAKHLKDYLDSLFFRNAMFCMFDIVFVTAANGLFVYAILTQTQAFVLAAEIGLAAVKLAWSMLVLPQALGQINAGDSSVVSGRRSTCLDLHVWLSIFNNVISPLLSMFADGDNCFLSVFSASAPIKTEQVYHSCIVDSISGDCRSIFRTISSSFVPPFIYSYQCSSGLIFNYVAVYLMMYTFMIAISWTFHMYLAFIVLSYPGDDTSYRNRFLKAWSPAAQSLAVLPRTLPSMSNDNDSKKTWDVQMFQYLVSKSKRADKYSCKVVVDLVVICTFGFAYPPLGLLVAISLVLETFEWSLLFCRCAEVYENCEKFRVAKYPQIQCGGVIDLLKRYRWVIVIMFCWFYGFFLFDITERCKPLKSLPYLLGAWPIALCIFKKLLSKYKGQRSTSSAIISSPDSTSNSDFSPSINDGLEMSFNMQSSLNANQSRLIGSLLDDMHNDGAVVEEQVENYTESPLRNTVDHRTVIGSVSLN